MIASKQSSLAEKDCEFTYTCPPEVLNDERRRVSRRETGSAYPYSRKSMTVQR